MELEYVCLIYIEIHYFSFSNYTLQMKQEDVDVPYGDEIIKYPVWRIEARDWVMSILTDPELSKELRFDAERIYRHNGEDFERIINEPWTANAWHDIQV